ncbi:hypothetical protein [Fodinibius saliphilus]|uniref:hypothetical protein n=1 Tax=Fodinibius saliphilus TaxID=1920650 RepID=UPI00110892E2|nr:hypothetical protein [Fodinibius saliphilus]
MSDRTIKNDLDFAVEFRLVKESGSNKPFKELGSHDGALIPKEDLGHVRLDFKTPKNKDIETVFSNYIQVHTASTIQSKPDYDIYSYHIIICELNDDWVGDDDEDVELIEPNV